MTNPEADVLDDPSHGSSVSWASAPGPAVLSATSGRYAPWTGNPAINAGFITGQCLTIDGGWCLVTPDGRAVGTHADRRLLPHESDRERAQRHRLGQLLATTPIPPEELVDNLALYLRRQPLTDLLGTDTKIR